ncbi:MAG TPA: guanylate kinase [Acidobacteriota bacterium]|nr:guanylate kinase [Acidobacteriota bacterium]
MSSKPVKGTLFVISAPSGAGKTSLAEGLLASVDGLAFSVSHTTRRPRKGELHGREYFFISVDEFEAMIEQGAFLEYACVYESHYYGTSRAFVESKLAEGIDVLLDIDVQGAMEVRRKVPKAVLIFVFPPSFQELKERLRKRGLDGDDEIERRLAIAAQEIADYRHYQYLIINDDLGKSRDELKSIVLAVRCQSKRRRQAAQRISDTFERETAAPQSD